MNKLQMQKCLNFRVRLRPIARRFRGEFELKAMDDDWLVTNIGERTAGIDISNIRTGHVVKLTYDQVHHYSDDLAPSRDGLRHGIFELRVQVLLLGRDSDCEPLPSYCPNCGSTISQKRRLKHQHVSVANASAISQ